MKNTPTNFYTVRALCETGRIRIRSEETGKPVYVQTLRGWRASHICSPKHLLSNERKNAMNTKTENRAEEQARAQVASIVGMVRALDVDYDRLQELREEKESFRKERMHDSGCNEACADYEWSEQNPNAAAELAELESTAGDCTSEDEARERIQEDPISIEVRSGWTSNAADFEPEEFRIVLCTGGPHVELVGDLSRGAPSRVRVLYRDWGTSGEYFPDVYERLAIEAYCEQFYFDE